MASNSIPQTVHLLLVKLKILSMISAGNKLNIGSMSFVDASSWIGSLKRSLAGEDRKSLLTHLQQTIQDAIIAIREYHDTEYCKLIINHIAGAKIGLKNLTSTYSDDPNVVAQIDVLIDDINLQIEKNKKLLDGNEERAESKRK